MVADIGFTGPAIHCLGKLYLRPSLIDASSSSNTILFFLHITNVYAQRLSCLVFFIENNTKH